VTPALSVEQAEAWAVSAASDRMARALREHDVWVAVDADVIGWVEVDQDRVAALYVAPAVARRGVGSSLLRLAETVIASASYPSVRLDASQNALGFYLRRGYVRSGPQAADGSWPLRKELPTLV
jgi:putative acetyltransferase